MRKKNLIKIVEYQLCNLIDYFCLKRKLAVRPDVKVVG